jgi:hypothetical protein
MRKLSEIQNEEALDVLADILEPTIEIASDKEVKAKEGRMATIQYVMKNHKSALLKILATLDGIPISEYKVNVIQIPVKVMELLNDKDLMDFFQSQGLTISDASSGSVTESTEETEKE